MTADPFDDGPDPCGLPAVALAATLAVCAAAGAAISFIAHLLFGRNPS